MTIAELKIRALEVGAAWIEGPGWAMMVESDTDDQNTPPFLVQASAEDSSGAKDHQREYTLERSARVALYYAYHGGDLGAHVPDPLFVAASAVTAALTGSVLVNPGRWETETPEGAVA